MSFSLSEIKEGLSTRFIGKEILFLQEAVSTNDVALKLDKEKAVEGTVVIADAQKEGRGQFGRPWISPAGVNIYLSIILKPVINPLNVPHIGLLSAIAVAEAINKLTNLQAVIKWPNDILINEKKTAGLLTEVKIKNETVKLIVVGIGVNVNMDESSFPSNLCSTATSLMIESGYSISRVKLVQEILAEEERWYAAYLQEGSESIIDEWKRLSNTIGQQVKFRFSDRIMEGKAIALDEGGALLVQTDAGEIKRLLSGGVRYL